MTPGDIEGRRIVDAEFLVAPARAVELFEHQQQSAGRIGEKPMWPPRPPCQFTICSGNTPGLGAPPGPLCPCRHCVALEIARQASPGESAFDEAAVHVVDFRMAIQAQAGSFHQPTW